MVDASCIYGAAFGFVCGDGFAGDGRFIDVGIASSHFSIHWNAASGFDDDKIAQKDIGCGYVNFFIVSHNGCVGGLHRKEVFDGRGTALFGPFFEVFSEQDQGDDHSGGFEVKMGVVCVIVLGKQVLNGGLIGAVYEGGGGGKGHQGVHVGLFVSEFFVRVDVEVSAAE